jgi:hypothetical protein
LKFCTCLFILILKEIKDTTKYQNKILSWYMRRNISLITILFIACLFFIKCEKNDDYPRKFILDSFSAGTLRLFTNSGEVTDPKRINNFISGSEDHFWIDTGSVSSDNWDVAIELLSETRARIIVNSDSIIDFYSTRKNGVLYLEYLDTLIRNGSLVNEKLKYHPLYIVNLPSYFGGQATVFVPCVYAIEEGDRLYIPVVSYLERIYCDCDKIIYSQGMSNYNNEFNTSYIDSISSMNLNDTILYQNNKVIYRKE